MADRRLLEDGSGLRQLEDATGLRLIEDGPKVAGGMIPFPGGYGFGSGGYGGGKPGSGGGGLGGQGQGGEGSGGGGGTGTTQTIRLPFRPGLVLFIATNQTLGGWRASNSGTFHWTCTGLAAWGDPGKGSIFNAAHITSYYAQAFHNSTDAAHGSGQYHGHCIWIRETRHGADTALAHVSAFHADGFDLVWDSVGGAGYPIYFVAARDQKSWADGVIGSQDVYLDGLSGGQQDNRPQGGFAFFHGDDRGGNGADFTSYLGSSVGTWARPDQGDNFEPVGGTHAAKNEVHEQAFWIDFDSEADWFENLPGNLAAIVMSPWIAGSLLQGWESLYLSNGQAHTDFDSNEPQGFAWATGALNSSDSRFILPAASGEKVTELKYDVPSQPNASTLKPQMGFSYMRPSQADGITIGHSVGLWARMVEDDPTKDFHAVIAVGRINASGRVASYQGLGASWLGEFSVSNPGDAPAGRIEFRVPGEIVTHTDQPSTQTRRFMLWLNGVTAARYLPQVYRRVRSY